MDVAQWDEAVGGFIDFPHALLPYIPKVIANGPLSGVVGVTKGLATFSGDIREGFQGLEGYEGVPVGGLPLIRAEGAAISRAKEGKLLL